jgi:hypothetical protein
VLYKAYKPKFHAFNGRKDGMYMARPISRHVSTIVVLCLIQIGFAPLVPATTINFDSLSDSQAVTNQFAGLGVTFSRTVALTAGVSLNELDFPPHSGQNAVTNLDGDMIIAFSQPTASVQGFFTYTQPITMMSFDANALLLGSVSSKAGCMTNIASAASLSCPSNEALGFGGNNNIKQVVIGGAFVMDDLSFETGTQIVPETTSVSLMALGLAVLFGLRRNWSES